jgi:Uma2 family endonuclease
MQTLVALPELERPARLVLNVDSPLTDKAYMAFCAANPDLHVERSAEGEILIVPPAGGESSYRSIEVAGELRQWAKVDGRGKVLDSSVQFLLPDGSAMSPDAAWVSTESLQRLTGRQRKQFLALCPEFIVEVLSPSDRLKNAKAKMQRWIANGVQLGWLIDGDAQTVYVYRKGRPVKPRQGVAQIAGEGPVQGFVLRLGSIWKGL